MQSVDKLSYSDVGRVAVSLDGYYRVKVISVAPDLTLVQHLKKTNSCSIGQVSHGFDLVSGYRQMYWEESVVASLSLSNGIGQMSNLQYLLTKLAEECTEVGQMAAKCQQFGMNEVYDGDGNVATNRERLHAEINDLLGVIDLFNEEEGFDFVRDERAISAKKEKIKKYRGYSIELGFVKGENK